MSKSQFDYKKVRVALFLTCRMSERQGQRIVNYMAKVLRSRATVQGVFFKKPGPKAWVGFENDEIEKMRKALHPHKARGRPKHRKYDYAKAADRVHELCRENSAMGPGEALGIVCDEYGVPLGHQDRRKFRDSVTRCARAWYRDLRDERSRVAQDADLR